MIKKTELERALYKIGYHITTSFEKVSSFIQRCMVEVDGADEFPASVIKNVAYSMLDIELEKELMKVLGI